jgi:hypothetical protein
VRACRTLKTTQQDADYLSMTWLHQHARASAVTAVVIVSAVAAVVIVRGGITVAVASPQYETPSNSTTVTVDMATEHHYGLADFKTQFAAQGIKLSRAGVRSGVSSYGDTRAGKVDDGFLITAYPKQGKVMFDSSGPKPLYKARLGNLWVWYGGHDKAFAARVAAAVSAIR